MFACQKSASNASGLALPHPVRRILIVALFLAACTRDEARGVRPAPAASNTLIGEAPPTELQASHWLNSEPLSLASLRGRVVFVRWFMSPDCPFCSGSAPALRELHTRYAKRGLVVIGLYHHKDAQPLDPEAVRGWAKHYGYEFPVAIDDDWRTLQSWWPDGHPARSFTSVSLLLDRRGRVQRVHPGGLIDPKSEEFRAIERDVERLLGETG